MSDKTLIIVESPAKAKTLGKFLGKKFDIKASMGHVRDLPRSQFGVDVDNEFAPKYITIRGKGEILKELRKAKKNAKRVLLASDPDREGEAIAWHLQQALDIDTDEACRIEFNEVTKEAVRQAVKNPRTIDWDRVLAQQARRVLDRLVGYRLSPLLWRKVRRGLSAGRVQSVAVHLLCEREKEIQAFIPEEYWRLQVDFATARGEAFRAYLKEYSGAEVVVPSEDEMKQILANLEKAEYRITNVLRKEKLRHSAPPFITSTLQQEASRRLNFTTRKTMQVAQQLYEGLDLGKEGSTGLITYIRTDSTRVSVTAQEEAKEYIGQAFGTEYLPQKPKQYAAKGKAQDAHEAIRPTSVSRTPERVKKYLTRDQLRLYTLIWSRFVASQMAPAIMDTTRVDIVAGRYTFRATGSIVKFMGFMQVYAASDEEKDPEESDKQFPELEKGELVDPIQKTPSQHFTQPPPRYSEATLVKTLEELGIGRPSTYAPVVETIQRRGYVAREKKTLYPTELGMVVDDLLSEYFPQIINAEFTAQMEKQLDDIEEGGADWNQVLAEFYAPFAKDVEKAEEEIVRLEIDTDEETDEECPKCGRNLVIKTGRFGRFVACPGFPECRYTKPIIEETGHTCPQCDGKVVVRRSKKGRVFFGCSEFPRCKFVVWDQPVDRECPRCNTFLVKKETKKNTTYKCASTECDYVEREDKGGEA